MCDAETEDVINNYILNAEDKRNQCLFRGQAVGFIYYQGMADALAQLITDLKVEENNKNHREVA